MKKSKKKNDYKKPNIFLHPIASGIFKIFSALKFNLKITENHLKGVKGGFVVLANHESALDFVNVSRALNRRANYVISNAFYETLPLRPIVDAVGVIPKNQFQTLPSDLKKMKTVVENGMPLVIFPAGLMPENGYTTPIPKATGKALKWLNKDVYVAISRGSYLTNPKWSKKWRKGKTTLSVTKFISKEELSDISAENLQEKVETALYFDAYKNNEKDKFYFKNGDNVEGLENVLYKCPKCESEYTIKSEGVKYLKCESCGYKVYSDNYGKLHGESGNKPLYEYPSDWSLYIEKSIENRIKKDKNFSLNSICKIFTIDKKKRKFVYSGEADIKLSEDGFQIKGKLFNEDFIKNYPVSNYPSLPLKPGKCFEIQDGKTILRIFPNNPIVCTEWVTTLEIMHKLKCNVS
ncbi:MAG: 1-acyl-sn-glycerol-3-phosphate acyltransferase [Clostridia bacterium]|nr:1-acyl-sn-glycerol-3-phosphate acyltransferase [Clostridia bacterium]